MVQDTNFSDEIIWQILWVNIVPILNWKLIRNIRKQIILRTETDHFYNKCLSNENKHTDYNFQKPSDAIILTNFFVRKI